MSCRTSKYSIGMEDDIVGTTTLGMGRAGTGAVTLGDVGLVGAAPMAGTAGVAVIGSFVVRSVAITVDTTSASDRDSKNASVRGTSVATSEVPSNRV